MSGKTRILVINGPNLNMLGMREPEIYGSQTLADIEAMCREKAGALGMDLSFMQSNHEGEIVDVIQQAAGKFEGVIINAAAFTHTSVAIHDALKLLSVPIIEVHLSDPSTREAFRHKSYIEPVASAVIKGSGAKGYVDALAEMGRLVGEYGLL